MFSIVVVFHKNFLAKSEVSSLTMNDCSVGSTSDIHLFRCSSHSSVSEEHLRGPSMSVCLSVNRVLLGTGQPPWPEVIVGVLCYNIVNRGHCWNALLMWIGSFFLTHWCNSLNLGHWWLTLLHQRSRITLHQWPWMPSLHCVLGCPADDNAHDVTLDYL
jgi:hypothetical protein